MERHKEKPTVLHVLIFSKDQPAFNELLVINTLRK